MRFFVTTPFSMEKPVKNQLLRLGIEVDNVTEGRVYFNGEQEQLAAACINIRCGDRIFREIASFDAFTFDELFDNVNKINWADIIGLGGKINVSAKCVRSKLMSPSDVQRITKMAIIKSIQRKIKKDKLPEINEEYPIEVHINKDKVTVALDCCGVSLHKRGYRVKNAVAPLRETFAAGLLEIAGYRAEKPFCDNFCGSGTLAIEAAMIGLNIAPGANRNFACEKFKSFDARVFDSARSKAKSEEKDILLNVTASDISPEMVDMARFHARRAGVENHINFKVCPAGKSIPKGDNGILIINPPYGERLEDRASMITLSKEIGQMLENYSSWNRFVLSGYKNFEKAVGKRAQKTRRFYNGNIECNLYHFFEKK
ncbi:MAG: class I SAM-dependent RNA methyltransferase [Clostridia bacterium]|nr:class I SAM-dependent RNA methyltransferase [Clostridia bacterium]